MYLMLTGKQLKLKRIAMDIKAKDLAEMIGVERSYISKMETGVQRVPEHIYERWIEVVGE